MDSKDTKNLPLAPFRKDLSTFPGPSESDGTPTYVLFDPVKGQYYKISLVQMIIMRLFKPNMSFDQLLIAVNEQSTFKISSEELKEVFTQAARLNLLEIPVSSEMVAEIKQKTKRSWLWFLLMNYLYIRIPLTNPDSFLTRTLPFVRPLISPFALIIYGLLILNGLLIVFLNFERYLHTFSYFFNFEGFLAYAGTIAIVKVLHEFAHAYTAKHFKIHVPTMGLAFLVLFPVLYTNVTNAWRLEKRSQRFAITIAGVFTELILAGLATLGWALTDPGILHSAFFLVSSTTWITSLLLNCNPAMRFDGYYLLCDLIGIDNLQQRGFAVARWRLREWFLGLNYPPPETDLSPRMINLMTVYSIYTWIYRIFLYTAIALFVYYEFTKALGIILFIVEVVVFIMAPFISEFKQLAQRKAYFNMNPRSIITGTLAALFLAWFLIPLPHVKTFPAITEAVIHQDLYIQEAAKVEEVLAKRGDPVKPGQVLLKLSSEPLELSLKKAEAEAEMLKKQIEILEQQEDGNRFLPQKQAELAKALSEVEAFKRKVEHLTVHAEISGTLYEFSDLLKPGLYLSKGTLIGKIAAPDKMRVIAFVPESESAGIQETASVDFKLQNPQEVFSGTIQKIYQSPTPYLYYPSLASIYKGAIPVVPYRGQDKSEPKLKLLEGYYQLVILLDPSPYPLKSGQTGVVEVQGPWESKLGSLLRRANNLIRKESGF